MTRGSGPSLLLTSRFVFFVLLLLRLPKLDNGSGDLFQRMLKDEEGHADFLDAQLHSITEMGIGTYLAQQLHGEK